MKTELVLSEFLSYEFSDEESYEGKSYISLKKITIYKGKKGYQVLTVKPDHWSAFEQWILEKCFTGEILYRPPRKADPNPVGDDRVPF